MPFWPQNLLDRMEGSTKGKALNEKNGIGAEMQLLQSMMTDRVACYQGKDLVTSELEDRSLQRKIKEHQGQNVAIVNKSLSVDSETNASDDDQDDDEDLCESPTHKRSHKRSVKKLSANTPGTSQRNLFCSACSVSLLAWMTRNWWEWKSLTVSTSNMEQVSESQNFQKQAPNLNFATLFVTLRGISLKSWGSIHRSRGAQLLNGKARELLPRTPENPELASCQRQCWGWREAGIWLCRNCNHREKLPKGVASGGKQLVTGFQSEKKKQS